MTLLCVHSDEPYRWLRKWAALKPKQKIQQLQQRRKRRDRFSITYETNFSVQEWTRHKIRIEEHFVPMWRSHMSVPCLFEWFSCNVVFRDKMSLQKLQRTVHFLFGIHYQFTVHSQPQIFFLLPFAYRSFPNEMLSFHVWYSTWLCLWRVLLFSNRISFESLHSPRRAL